MSDIRKNRNNSNEMPNVSNQQLQQQLSELQSNFDDLQDRFAEVQKQLVDSTEEAHKTKHSVANIQSNMEGFKNLFERQNGKLDQIYESLLQANYEKRISRLEAKIEMLEAYKITADATINALKYLVGGSWVGIAVMLIKMLTR